MMCSSFFKYCVENTFYVLIFFLFKTCALVPKATQTRTDNLEVLLSTVSDESEEQLQIPDLWFGDLLMEAVNYRACIITQTQSLRFPLIHTAP